MKKSCGIIIVNDECQILMGHSTGNVFFDIPKGGMEDGESPVQSAVRECQEESSLIFSENELKDLGEFAYNKEKRIHLFLTFVKKSDIALSDLVCNTYFEHFTTKKVLPEVDSFAWIDMVPGELDKKCAKSMARVLKNLLNDGLLISDVNSKPYKKIII